MGLLALLDYIVIAIGACGFAYQLFCIVVGWFGKVVKYPEVDPKHICVVISARNESAVIGELLDSIEAQDYPKEFLDVWVCADNCTDDTADICRSRGAYVVERFNKDEIGKGYALGYLFENMMQGTFGKAKAKSKNAAEIVGRQAKYEAFLVLDADNILKPDYVTEMNKVFSSGYRVVTSYRNSKNFSSNWVSSGSALWFVRESRLLNNSRQILGASCHVGGTGFMFARSIMERNGGWKHRLLTEDLEFTMDCVLNGDKVGYCGTAMLFDEQPVTFSQSWRQRLRWSKGFLQVFRHYADKLIRRAFREGDFSCLDLTLLIFPWVLFEVIRLGIGAIWVSLGFVSLESQIQSVIYMGRVTLTGSLFLMGVALLTVFIEGERIGARKLELLSYVLSFPIYVLSYLPISIYAIFSKVEWKPITHGAKKDDSKTAVKSR
ncbi:MAG: glycosyltransferase family 2 protein [Candidatus Ancillula sp.]|jgi:cellulose synthase/poly-beta-1,6-N-acetylglucosamine synthase-like glycosyltransferase|nr:glycosyltransferase family 2 protein [Candidatus Ancillula sp.]